MWDCMSRERTYKQLGNDNDHYYSRPTMQGDMTRWQGCVIDSLEGGACKSSLIDCKRMKYPCEMKQSGETSPGPVGPEMSLRMDGTRIHREERGRISERGLLYSGLTSWKM